MTTTLSPEQDVENERLAAQVASIQAEREWLWAQAAQEPVDGSGAASD